MPKANKQSVTQFQTRLFTTIRKCRKEKWLLQFLYAEKGNVVRVGEDKRNLGQWHVEVEFGGENSVAYKTVVSSGTRRRRRHRCCSLLQNGRYFGGGEMKDG
jgi:hypothetical protein